MENLDCSQNNGSQFAASQSDGKRVNCGKTDDKIYRNNRRVELLAPAGDYDCLRAVFGAGADAAYAGGKVFGARAYAGNFGQEELLCAIRETHVLGKRLYLTVNTLVKNRELYGELYDYIGPLYDAGLDAVLVQDFGVLCFLRKYFPSLPLHASTQMAVTGEYGMRFLSSLGVTRIVAARELSIAELRRMHEASDLEIEAVIHRALCYCYSGRCLMSSMIGGRSGNRGRCAQPCRLPFEVRPCGSGQPEGRSKVKGGTETPLSMKDMYTLAILPELVGAGISSLKIEGRMKSREYAYGVTEIYRKYLDRCLREGRMQRLILWRTRTGSGLLSFSAEEVPARGIIRNIMADQ